MKLYKAMVWSEYPNKPGQRVSVQAESLEAAKKQLEAEHGERRVVDLHNEEDAARPR